MTLRDLNARFSLGFFLYNFTIFKQNVLSIRFFLEKHFIPETCGNMENYFQGLFRYIPRDKVCVRTEDYFEHLFHKINESFLFLYPLVTTLLWSDTRLHAMFSKLSSLVETSPCVTVTSWKRGKRLISIFIVLVPWKTGEHGHLTLVVIASSYSFFPAFLVLSNFHCRV